ncbi:MAG: PfkB family carbohydrate kinase [Planctomycetota bacterium]|nr:PfkB family carbohydrate kinase [Planctomycetota bacterium]
MIDRIRLQKVFDDLPHKNFAVVGDLFLDQYLQLDSTLTETSIETGLDAYQVTAMNHCPGAAGTVLNNLSALTAGHLNVVSIIGEDGAGFELKRLLYQHNIDLSQLIVSSDRWTPTYTKPMLQVPDHSPQELNRIDTKNRIRTPAYLQEQICDHLDFIFPHIDGIIVSDQVPEPDCGILTSQVRSRLCKLATQYPDVICLVDSRSHIDCYRNVWLKPNLEECIRAVKSFSPLEEYETPEEYALALAKHSETRLFCTLGEKGMIYCAGIHTTRLPGYSASRPVDIVGAGDSASAGILCGLCCGLSAQEAGTLGNLIASITVRQIGTTGTATPLEVIEQWKHCHAE